MNLLTQFWVLTQFLTQFGLKFNSILTHFFTEFSPKSNLFLRYTLLPTLMENKFMLRNNYGNIFLAFLTKSSVDRIQEIFCNRLCKVWQKEVSFLHQMYLSGKQASYICKWSRTKFPLSDAKTHMKEMIAYFRMHFQSNKCGSLTGFFSMFTNAKVHLKRLIKEEIERIYHPSIQMNYDQSSEFQSQKWVPKCPISMTDSPRHCGRISLMIPEIL